MSHTGYFLLKFFFFFFILDILFFGVIFTFIIEKEFFKYEK